jgi:hypothetical protein
LNLSRNIGRRSQGVARALLHLSPGISHLILQILRGAAILVLPKFVFFGPVQIAHDGLFSGVRVSEGLACHHIVGSLFELVGDVLRHAAGVAAEIGLGDAFAAASAADIVASLAAQNPDCAASAACFTLSLA